jgi:hypothetical protein
MALSDVLTFFELVFRRTADRDRFNAVRSAVRGSGSVIDGINGALQTVEVLVRYAGAQEPRLAGFEGRVTAVDKDEEHVIVAWARPRRSRFQVAEFPVRYRPHELRGIVAHSKDYL